MLHDYFDITEGVVIEWLHRVEKQDKLKQATLLKIQRVHLEKHSPSERHKCSYS